MKQAAQDRRPHFISQVLTGAMFDILIRLSKHYVGKRGQKVGEAFWNTIQRMQHMSIQPLDLLPPVDVTFGDYARAVLRAEEIANPTDQDGYRHLMLDVFVKRGILEASDRAELGALRQLFNRLDLDVFHDVEAYARSRTDAYLFLDDNRRKLFIPRNVDLVLVDVCTAQKLTREARRMPKQVILQYVWREDVVLDGARFGRFDGATTSLLCGGTLAVNQQGDVLHWARKPGSQRTGAGVAADAELEEGIARRTAFLDALARRIRTGTIGREIGGDAGLLAKAIPPLTSRTVDGSVRFELSPHFTLHDDGDDRQGGRAWQISS